MEVDDTEDDPVDLEIDVYLSKQLTGRLLLLQYPVRPASMTYDEAEFLSSKLKPKQCKLQLDLALNTHTHSYDRSKGEQIAINVDGPNPGVNAFFQTDRMDKHVLTSQPSGVNTKRYVAGFLKDGELHLNPLHNIVQLRPNFVYLDRADTKNKADLEPGDSQDEEEPEAKAVTVKFARRETDEAKARRLASYEYMRKRAEEESWVPLTHHALHTQRAHEERELLYAHKVGDEGEFAGCDQPAYLEQLIPRMRTHEAQKPALPSNVLSLAQLKLMSLPEQVRALLVNAKVIGFSQLLTYLAQGADPAIVLRALQQVALLVQGCWVVKSEILYPEGSCSPHSGAPAEMLCRGRDYIMWRFTQHRCIIRKDITSVIKLQAEDVKDFLEQMSRLKANAGWEFLLRYDHEFIARHPDVVQRQHMIWEAKFKQLSTVLKLPPGDHKMAAAAQAAQLASPPRARRRTASRIRTKSGGDRSMSDVSGDEVERARRASGGRSASGVGGAQRNRRASGSSSPRVRHASGNEQRRGSDNSAGGDACNPAYAFTPLNIKCSPSSRERTGSIDMSAYNTPGNHISAAWDATNGSSNDYTGAPGDYPSAPGVDYSPEALQRELTSFLRAKLLSHAVLRLRDARSLLNMELTSLPPGHVLGRGGVSDRQLQEALPASGGVRVLSAQILSGGEPVFALGSRGDALDPIRLALLDLMQKQPKLSNVRQLVQRVEEDGEGEVTAAFTDADYKRVVNEYCEKSSNISKFYYLRGFLPKNT